MSEHLIKLLPEDVSNQIAAGEVVERPSSIVKELVENSIDAGATEIIVDIQNGGRTLKITDNGKGIPSNQVQLAFKRFATSKIREEKDLWNLNTMGFRGEALPSIASVSKVELKTKVNDELQGTKITIHGNTIQDIEPIGYSQGTAILIEDLFYNTPARLKFLKSDNTEVNHIIELLQSFAICNHEISFSVINKSRETIRTNGANSSMLDAVRQIFGKDVSDNLIEVNYENSYGKVIGLVSNQTYARSDKNKQMFFINNRWVKVPFFTRMLDEVYSDILANHKHPVAFLKVFLHPSEVDINVHPSKKEVRFHSYSSVYDLVYKGIMNSLYPVASKLKENINNNEIVCENDLDSNYFEPINNFSTESFNSPFNSKIEPVYQKRSDDVKVNLSSYNPNRFANQPKEGTYKVQQFSFYDELREYKNNEENREDLQSIKPIGRIYELYIIGYLGSDLCFIDQHLAHERYLYEQLELDVKSKQELMTPIMIHLSDIEWDNYKENKELFEQYGYEIQEFGNKTVILRAIPSVLDIAESEAVFRNVLDEMIKEEGRKKTLDKLTHVKKTIACKAAVKAGMHLDMEEIKILIKNWAKTKQPYNCPHGRPVIYRLPKADIDKHFNRTW
ncbi:MAG: DNA mismatch repair endonuclease MutL [Candidatus Sericytochromatia bacterium]